MGPLDPGRVPLRKDCNFCNSYQIGADRLASLTKEVRQAGRRTLVSDTLIPNPMRAGTLGPAGVLSKDTGSIMSVPPLLPAPDSERTFRLRGPAPLPIAG